MTRTELLRVWMTMRVRAKLPNGKEYDLPIDIRHRMQKSYGGLADLCDLIEGKPITHRMVVYIPKESLDMAWAPRRDLEHADVEWEELGPLVTKRTRRAYENKGELPVAMLGYQEFPAWVHFDYGGNWWQWLDAIDAETAWVGALADEVTGRQEDSLGRMPLLNGSLFYFRTMSVHPAFQGQQLGLKLLAHALWASLRAEGDTAIILVAPATNYFDPRPDRVNDHRDLGRLGAYYSRLGFKPLSVGQPPDPRDPLLRALPMYLHFGQGGLPVYGLGPLGLSDPPEKQEGAAMREAAQSAQAEPSPRVA